MKATVWVVYDPFCGLGGWSEGFLAEGYECIGFDIEAHDYGTGGYPGKLILRDIRSIHGSELKDATCIVASPPCQEPSYRAMCWKRAKALTPQEVGLPEPTWWRIPEKASKTQRGMTLAELKEWAKWKQGHPNLRQNCLSNCSTSASGSSARQAKRPAITSRWWLRMCAGRRSGSDAHLGTTAASTCGAMCRR